MTPVTSVLTVWQKAYAAVLGSMDNAPWVSREHAREVSYYSCTPGKSWVNPNLIYLMRPFYASIHLMVDRGGPRPGALEKVTKEDVM